MKKWVFLGICAAACIGLKFLNDANTEHRKMKAEVYHLLEKDYLTEDEKDRIDGLTDPDMMKEDFIMLDDAHRELFKRHFGKER